MKRTERIALGLRTVEGINADTIDHNQVDELISNGLLGRSDGRLFLTQIGKLVADSVAAEVL